MYDMLPQGLFHQPAPSKKFNIDKDDILQEMALYRKEEFFARKFFQPFEIIMDETVTEAFLLDLRLHKKINYPDFINLFVSYLSCRTKTRLLTSASILIFEKRGKKKGNSEFLPESLSGSSGFDFFKIFPYFCG